MIKNIFRVLSWSVRYKNWLEILGCYLKAEEPSNFMLRNGVAIESPEKTKNMFLVEEIFFDKVYTPGEIKIEDNDVVVDIGSNIGVFTVFAAKLTRNSVYAFEPFPQNVELLKRNIDKNNLQNVVINPVAVSDRMGGGKLFLSDINAGHLLFDHNISGKLDKYIEVPTVDLKQIFDGNKLEVIDFMKMDCEGMEGLIFKNTPVQYLKRIRKIALEFHDNVSALGHVQIQNLLEDAGFIVNLKWDGYSPFGYIYAKRLNSGNDSGLWDKVWLKSGTDTVEYKKNIKNELNTVTWKKIEKEVIKRYGGFRGLKVIELGSGRGSISLIMGLKGADVTLMDYSDVALKRAQHFFDEFNCKVKLINSDVLNLPIETMGQFDISMSFGLAEHFDGIKRQGIFDSHFKVLKDGGSSFISVPNKWCLPYRIWKKKMEITNRWAYGFEKPFSGRELKRMALASGFKPGNILGSSFLSDFDRFLFFDILKRFGIDPQVPTFLDNRFGYALVYVGYKNMN